MIQAIRDEQQTPVCPHCEAELKSVLIRKVTGGVRYVYFCPLCRKVLGFSHRKSFWMG